MYGPSHTGGPGSLSPTEPGASRLPPLRSRILVYHEGEDEGVPQPAPFQCCPLGASCYCRKEIDLFHLIDFTLECPASEGGMEVFSCTGMVTRCEFDE